VLHQNIVYQYADRHSLRKDAGGVSRRVPGTSTTDVLSADGNGHPDLSHTTQDSQTTVSPLLSLSFVHYILSSTNIALH
jgi:hypothetical protein